MSESSLIDSAKLEMPLLRQELQNLKMCQFAFLTTSFTVTGLILGFVPNLTPSSVPGSVFLIPLVVVLPAFCFFFDKARTITRIVGYYRILEDAINNPGFPGWENALSISRKETSKKTIGLFIRVMLMRQPHGYWSLAFYTFAALSILCIIGAWKFFNSQDIISHWHWFLMLFSTFLVLIGLIRNFYMIWDLTMGKSTYEDNYEKWRKLLGITPPHV